MGEVLTNFTTNQIVGASVMVKVNFIVCFRQENVKDSLILCKVHEFHGIIFIPSRSFTYPLKNDGWKTTPFGMV